MRKFIAMLLTVTLLVTGYGSCFADRVKLPASLLSIEKETFYGDTSVKEVVVPYGTQYIMARAFAYSGVEKIYIPDTVTFIASNAFEGLDDLWIIAEEDSYAYNFAQEYDYYWKDANDFFELDKLLKGQELYDSIGDSEPKPVSREEILPDKLALYDIDGITEEEGLEVFKQANSQIEEYNHAIDSFEQGMDEIKVTMEEVTDVLEPVSIAQSSENTTINLDGTTFNLSGFASSGIGSDFQVKDVSIQDDGSGVKIELNGQGKTAYITINSSGAYVNNTSYNTMSVRKATSNSASKSGYNFGEIISKLRAYSNKLNNWLNKVKPQLKNEEKQADIIVKESKNTVDKNKRALDLLEQQMKNPKLYNQSSKALYDKRYTQARMRYESSQNNYNIAVKNHKDLGTANGIVACVTIFENFKSLLDNCQKAWDMYGLQQHGHPTDIENVTPELLDYAKKVDQYSEGCLYVACAAGFMDLVDIINKIAVIVNKFSVLGGLPGLVVKEIINVVRSKWVKITKQAIFDLATSYLKSMGITLAFQTVIPNLYKEAYDADAHLHGYIVGYVTDEVTGQKLKAVAVMMDGRLVYTNANGYYEMMSGVGTEQLLFKKEWYVDKPLTVNVEAATSYRRDVQLKPKGKLSGTAKDATTGAPLSGVRVTCGGYQTFTNSQGFYNFNLEESGSVTVRFEKEGYIPYEDHASVSPGMTTPVDAPMSRELEEDEYRVVLSWGSTPADLDSHLYQSGGYHIWYSHKSATNANLDLDDTNGYGPETTTFKIDTVSTYTYYVHDFTNKGSTNTGALGRSGAKVVVYRGNKILGTYYVPSGGGTAWKVFTITQGEFKVVGTIGYYSLAS
ncbi:MAG: carboxypeptidase regulatory-like domain-containing protein [Clostridia bacterium]|nr:carboxypeptidase regulatory-like domain-containing protein [Clostridia bacterium]